MTARGSIPPAPTKNPWYTRVMRTCRRCQTDREEDQFHSHPRGLRWVCIPCVKQRNKERGCLTSICPGCGNGMARRSARCAQCRRNSIGEVRPLVFRKDSHGYMTCVRQGVTYSQHRVIMESIIGRPLLPGENVHHKNGDRADNHPSNLELWVSIQPAGQRPEDLVEFAREILKRYDPPDSELA